MAVYAKHHRIEFSGLFGTLDQPVEIWAWGLTFRFREDLHQSLSATAAAASAAWSQYIAPKQNAAVLLTRTRFREVASTGLTATFPDGQYVQADDLSVGNGQSTAGGRVPTSVATCVSFQSLFPGPRGKGRAFLPSLQAQIDGTYRYAPADAMDLATRMRDLVRAIVAPQEDYGQIGPISLEHAEPGLGAHVVATSNGQLHAIRSYRVGCVPDTMRSRRNAMDEAYQVAPA